jgi:hypothetical protein
MANWNVRVQALRNILQHFHSFRNDKYRMENPTDGKGENPP